MTRTLISELPSKQTIGNAIEDLAAEYYLRRGAQVVARNYRCKMGELDLIVEERARDGDGDGDSELVFVEVRFRQSQSRISGLESVDWKKRQKLRRAVQHYLSVYQGHASTLRFDVLDWDGYGWSHVQNARLDL